MTDDHLHGEERPLYDSGYTDRELDGIFRSLVNGDELDWLESFVSAFVIGLCDGDVVPLTQGGTVRLRTPRAEIDSRVAAVRATMKDGATFREAFCDLPGE
jgi:hypothetical protein